MYPQPQQQMPPQAGGAGGMTPQPPAAAPIQGATPMGVQPLDPRQQQMMDAIAKNLTPEELSTVRMCLTPELSAIVVKLFGPQVDYMLQPLMQAATSNTMMDAGDNIGGVDIDHAAMDQANQAGQTGYPAGSVSAPFRQIRA